MLRRRSTTPSAIGQEKELASVAETPARFRDDFEAAGVEFLLMVVSNGPLHRLRSSHWNAGGSAVAADALVGLLATGFEAENSPLREHLAG